MYEFIYIGDIAAWLLIALAAWKFLPKVRIPFWTREQNEAAPWTGLFWLGMIATPFFFAVMIGALSVTLTYYLARDGWHYRPSPDTLFHLGFIGSVAQIVGALSASAIIVRCWPFAVTFGATGLWLLSYYNFI